MPCAPTARTINSKAVPVGTALRQTQAGRPEAAPLFLYFITQPHRAVAHALHALQPESHGSGIRPLYAVEHGSHAFPPVYAGTDHHTDLIQQPGGEESPVHMASAHQSQTLDAETLPRQFHGPVQVNLFLSDSTSVSGYTSVPCVSSTII